MVAGVVEVWLDNPGGARHSGRRPAHGDSPLPVSLRRLLPCLLLSLGLPAQAAPACPAGQQSLCVGSCFCVPASAEIEALHRDLGRLAAQGLERWLQESRDALVARGADQPIPLHVRAQLEPYFDLRVLETARFAVGDATQFSAANTLLHNPDVQAVTLIDVVVFRSAAAAQDDVALWAHELKHVEQYLEWGVRGFAERYSRDHQAVEAPGYAMQRRVAADLRAAQAPLATTRE